MQRKRKPLTQLDDYIITNKRQRSVSADNDSERVARAGTISKMILKNFMCHSHLEVNLTNNVNYIIGRNGSGKSAILTALMVGLGGKASLTNRGNNVKGFIKVGKNSSTVEITINNAGSLSYQQNKYGDEITIIRHFVGSGGSSYKIKSASGHIVSTQAKEVQRICNGLNVQIDNPVCLLNQDTARNFLNSKDPRQKFILFMRATRLETLFEEYKQIFQNKKDAVRMLKEKEELYKKLKKELEELHQKVENHKSIAGFNNKAKCLQVELLWAKVHDSEDDVKKQEDTVNQLEEEKSAHQNMLRNEVEKRSSIEQTVQNLQQQIHELQESIDQQIVPRNAFIHSLSELKESLNEKRREKRIVLKDIAVKTGNCNILENEISQITENLTQIEQEKIKRLHELSELEEKIKSVENRLETIKNEQFQIRNSITHLHKEEHSLNAEIKQISLEIGATHSRLTTFERESNLLSVYGSNMPRIIDAINAAKNKFVHLPRGPLGSYIKLKDKKWAVAVEGFLNSALLCAFTVDNKKDNELLMSIFQRICTGQSKPMVITSKFFFKTHDISQNLVMPTDDCISIYSALEISDPVVANCLIDQTSLESILLIPSNEKAIELMSDRTRVPKNCQQGVTIEGDKFYPDPNYKTYCSQYRQARFLQVSTADMISQLKQKLLDLENKKTSAANQHESIKKAYQDETVKLKAVEVNITKLIRARALLVNQHIELSNANEPDAVNMQQLQTELAELKKSIEERNIVSQRIEEALEKLKTKINEKETDLEKIKTIVQGYEERIDPLNQQILEQMAKRKDYDVNKRFITKRLEESTNKVGLARSELLNAEQTLERYTQQASVIGERPDKLREVPVIMEELNSVQSTIRQLESDVETADIVVNKWEECKKRYKHNTQLMKTLSDDVKKLQHAADKRNRYYQHTEDYFITFVKHSFKKVLEFRQFQGSLEIDMQGQKLELIVIPQQGSQGATTTTNLSGGERSFSTVAFLYSLWQCMEFPFYFLDEFDVFMDKVNRAKVMEILLYHAKSRPDLQFVFLTPQDISFVNDKAVAINRLEDPKRAAVNGN